MFLDISKDFDRVWHEGIGYKVKSIGVTGLPMKLFQSFLIHRFQRVVLNGQGLTNLIFGCTDFLASKMVLHAHLCK